MCLCFPRQILRGWGGHNTQMNHSRTFHVPVFYYIDPSGVGWALPPITSRHCSTSFIEVRLKVQYLSLLCHRIKSNQCYTQ
jgi:hypothetical protein